MLDPASKSSVKRGQLLVGVVNIFSYLNPLSANANKWSKTSQNCLSVFHQFFFFFFGGGGGGGVGV